MHWFSSVFARMSWRCSGSSNVELVDNLVKNGIVKSTKIADVMKSVDRDNYTKAGSSYQDAPQSIGYGVTISAPHMVSLSFQSIESIITKANVFTESIKCYSREDSIHKFLLQHAYALEMLENQLKEGMKALDVGSGSGYLTACFALMVKKLFKYYRVFLPMFKYFCTTWSGVDSHNRYLNVRVLGR